MTVTEIRHQLAQAVSTLPGDATVTLGLADYATGEASFSLEIRVGEPGEDSMQVVDRLYVDVPAALDSDPEIGPRAAVGKCSGHRLYSSGPGAPVELGCEWTIRVLT